MSRKKDQKKSVRESEGFQPSLRYFLFSFPFFFTSKLGHWICLIFLARYLFYLPIKELSGENTTFLLDLALKLAADKWIYFLACGLFGGGWYRERRSFQKYRKRHSQHEKELMNHIDQNRGSSGLTDIGTPPELGEKK